MTKIWNHNKSWEEIDSMHANTSEWSKLLDKTSFTSVVHSEIFSIAQQQLQVKMINCSTRFFPTSYRQSGALQGKRWDEDNKGETTLSPKNQTGPKIKSCKSFWQQNEFFCECVCCHSSNVNELKWPFEKVTWFQVFVFSLIFAVICHFDVIL